MRKKADSTMMGVVVIVILGLVFLAFATTWLTRLFSPKLDEKIINQACQQSFFKNAYNRVPVVGEQTDKFNCPTRFITFHENMAESEFEYNPLDTSGELKPVKAKDVTYANVCPDQTKEKDCMFYGINKVIADEMARCWVIVGRGENRVFSISKKERQCFVCSTLYFDDNMIKKFSSIGLVGLSHPSDESYSLDVFMRNKGNMYEYGIENYYKNTEDFIDINVQEPYYDYELTHEYSVVFVALNKDFKELITDELWAKYIEGNKAGSDEGNYINTLEFIRNDEVSQKCDTWA